ASEPYRNGTPIWTVATYDVLNRPRTITNPDPEESVRTMEYYGNITTLTDESGKQRNLITNAAGQIVRVEEPHPTLSSPWQTDYTYYAFGPLHQVTQGSQTRTFNYDWLGRKLNELHPETAISTGHSYSYEYEYND